MNKNQYLENIIMGLGTLRGHKIRSLLTILGVIIGVMTVIVIASILTGMRQNIVNLVEEFGTDNIYAFHLTTGPSFGHRDRREWNRKPLRVEDAMAIKAGTDAVREVTWEGFAFGRAPTLKYAAESYKQGRVRGVSPAYAEVTNMVLSEGRFFGETEDTRRAQVCVLGVSVVEALFPNTDTIVGRSIQIDGNSFSVVGVLEKRKSSFMGENEEDNMVLIPYRTFRKLNPKSDWLFILIRANEGQLGRALDNIEAILRRQRNVRFDKENDFDLTTADKMVEQFDSITASIGIIAIAISGVGLLVGGIGVMNIMLVSVTERTREIGIRKAVGARRQDITFQFLFEAMTLTTVGGVIGIVLAALASYIIMFLVPALPAQVPLWAVIAGFTVSLFVGLVFGVWPAVKASRLDPIECLHYE
ncbi:MAG: FtsX-like permease family protein [Acidobacteria bacterium]|nr:MAG: FtsX-like permease family protein [Acidobacteriota bacterium]